MLSVTSDVSASATYQNAPPKPALPDPAQLASSFSDLVDSNLPADPASTLPPAPEPPPAPRVASNAAAPDNTTPRNSQASDQPPSSQSGSSSNSAPPAASDTTNTNAVATTNAPATSSVKSGMAKTPDGKSTDKTSTDTTGKAGDTSDQAKPAEAQTVVQNPIAALIPVVTAPVNPQTTPVNANAPLAIAAAAIAATSSTTAATAPPQLATPTPAPKGATGTTTKTTAAAATIGAATAQQVAADPTATVDAAVEIAAGTPGATTAKTTTGLKTTQLTQGKAATTASAGAAPTTADASASATTSANNANGANAAPQPTADAKPDQANAVGDAVKADAGASSAPSTTAPSPHDHAAAANAQAPAADADPNAQLAVLPQQVSSTAAVNPTDKLTVTQATGAAVPVSGLAVEIAASAQSGKTHFEVRLDPADLGRIDVRIAVDRSGQVTSHQTVEKPETLSMLQQDAPQLQQALNDAGLKTGSGGLQFSLRDQSSQSGQNNFNQSGQPQRLVISEDDTVPAAVAGRSYGRMPGANGGVDIRV